MNPSTAADHEMRDLGPPWHLLEEVARRLETLGHKQLRGAPFNEEEKSYLARDYGNALGGFLLHRTHRPRDDAPRAADVFSDPGNSGKYLIAATGKPHALYVLYPWKGKEILCRGAVLPFHEFRSATHLTDAEWMKLLESKEPPDDHDWIKPILSRTPTKGPGEERE